MAIIPYEASGTLPETISIFQEYNTDASILSKSLFTAIGNFWTQYYTDLNVVNSLYSGMVSLLAQDYLGLLNSILASNILDIPVESPYKVKLLIFSSADRITNYIPGYSSPSSYDFTMTDLSSMTALVNAFFEPDVVLENGTHFDIIGNKIRFYVDIFNDLNITKDVYRVSSNGVDYILLLAVDLVLTEYSIYEKYGTFLYKKLPNTLHYKLINTALQIFFTSNTNTFITETTLNILLGLPFCTKNGEIVTTIVPSLDGVNDAKVYTTKNTYSVHPWAEILVSVGQKLTIGTLIGRWTTVSDLISNPTWYYDSRFPYELITRWSKEVYEKGYYNVLIPYYNSKFLYNGAISYIDVPQSTVIDPSEAFEYAKKWYRSLKGSSVDLEEWLYEQYEGYLKYNTFQIRTELNFDNYTYFTDVRSQFMHISKGIPTYLYPVVDTIFKAYMSENIFVGEETSLTIKWGPWEEWVEFKIPYFQYFYNGAFTYSGDVQYASPFTFRYLQLDDSSCSIAVKFDFEDISNFTGDTSYAAYYDGTYTYDKTLFYLTPIEDNEDFSLVVISKG